MKNENDKLVKVENVSAIKIYIEGGMDELLNEIEDIVNTFVPDISTDQGRKYIASIAHKVARSKTYLDMLGKDLIEKAQREVNAVNTERKNMRDRLDALKIKVRKPLTDYEEKKKARDKEIEDKIDLIIGLGSNVNFNGIHYTSAQLQENLDSLKAFSVSVDTFGERTNEAAEEKDHAIAKVEMFIKNRIEKEKQDAELKKERIEKKQQEQKEHEERIRKEAEEKAKREAEEKRLADIKAVEETAEREKQKLIREQKEKEQAERDRKEAKEKAERERIENEEHRLRINRNIFLSLREFGVAEDLAMIIIKAMEAGRLPHVKINY